MEFIKFTGTNFPPVEERVLCRIEYWADSTQTFWINPKNRTEYYIVLYWDGKVWREGWNGFELRFYKVTHYSLIQRPNIE